MTPQNGISDEEKSGGFSSISVARSALYCVVVYAVLFYILVFATLLFYSDLFWSLLHYFFLLILYDIMLLKAERPASTTPKQF